MAVLAFSSSGTYELASISDVKEVKYDDRIYVAGFPFNGSLNLRYEPGEVVASADVGIDQGYQLLYSNRTMRGMSGGPLLNSQGKIIGIHGRGERDEKRSSGDFVVKTGINQGVPIHYFNQFVRGLPVVIVDAIAKTPDDYLAQAKASIGEPGREQTVIRLANQVLKKKANSEEAYFMRAYAKDDLGDKQGAINDLNQAIEINPQNANSYRNRGIAKSALGNNRGAIADYNRAIAINPQDATAYTNRGVAKKNLGDKLGAIADYSQAIMINPKNDFAYKNRGNVKFDLGNYQGAIADYSQAIAINPRQKPSLYEYRGAAKFYLGDRRGGCSDCKKAALLGSQSTIKWLHSDGGAWCRSMP